MVDRVVTVCIDGVNMRVNPMQPLKVCYVTDDDLPVAKRSAAVLARYNELSGVTGPLPKVNVRHVRAPPRLPPGQRFQMPAEYIKYRVKKNEEMDAVLEYDIDEEDLKWLDEVNEKLKKEGEERLDIDSFEIAMDRLEKESFFQASGKMASCPKAESFYKEAVDQDALCCVCNDGEVSNMNQIIFCDMCNIAVHQDCYGVPYVPEGQWLCRRCQMSPSEPVSCVLCPSPHGAFKKTADGRWAHVICALWISEVSFANSVFMEPIDNIAHSLERRRKLRCIVCKQKMGSCLQCSRKSCMRSFHVTCANAAGMEMRMEMVDNPKKDGIQEIKYTAYCHFHSTDFAKTGGTLKSRKKIDDMMKMAREKLAESHATVPPVSIPTVPEDKLESIREKANLSSAVLRYIVAYWFLKRKARFGVPLLRRLVHGKTHPLSPDPSHPVAGGEAASAVSSQFSAVRANLERVRLLCELVKKREKMKQEYYDVASSLVRRLTKPLAVIMQETIDKIASKDYNDVFAKPVSEKEVPGYSSIIKKPMDLSLMRKKLAKGEYKNLSQLKADFVLMMNNCSTFNRHNDFFWKYGLRLHRIGMKYIHAAEHEANAHILAPEIMKQASIALNPDDEQTAEGGTKDSPGGFAPPAVPSTSKKVKTPATPTRASTRKRTLRSFEDEAGCRVTIPSVTSDAFSAYRSKTSPRAPITDSSAVEDTTSADEDPSPPKRALRSSKRTRHIPPPERVIDTVEIGCDFQHDDIVWVEEDGRKVGRIIDLRMKIFVSDMPIDDMLEARPADYSQHLLVKFFGEENSWRWVHFKFVTHCDLQMINPTIYPPIVQQALREAKAF